MVGSFSIQEDRIKTLLAVCQILSKYKGLGVSAEHDIVYLGVKVSDVSAEDQAKLETLGCHLDDGQYALYV